MSERAQTDLLKAFKNICLQQRVIKTAQSPSNFRKTLAQLFQDASDDELDNLAIDVETEGGV